MKTYQKWILACVLIIVVGAGAVFGINLYVVKTGQTLMKTMDTLTPADCVIVPGAGVVGGAPTDALAKRLNCALEVYQKGLAPKILVSGDHGQKGYDEVNVMRDFLLKKGVDENDIFMDHAGFSTYETMYRARDVFLASSVIVATQAEQAYRALYIGKKLGMDCQGVAAEPYLDYIGAGQNVREILARIKAFLDCDIFHAKPTFLGETIPVSGSGLATLDGLT